MEPKLLGCHNCSSPISFLGWDLEDTSSRYNGYGIVDLRIGDGNNIIYYCSVFCLKTFDPNRRRL